jgi:SAM-dependent methyltransferase
MAKIEIVRDSEELSPPTSEIIEVRTWGSGGRPEQNFFIGSGLNFTAVDNIWIEVIYTVNGAQIFYSRNFIHVMDSFDDIPVIEARLEEFEKSGVGGFGFAGMMPETGVYLKGQQRDNDNPNAEAQTYSFCDLNIFLDTGVVFGMTAPGERMVEINLPFIHIGQGAAFMRELIADIAAAYQGKHPDPGSLPPGSSDWPLVRQLNQRAYDTLSVDYQEKYFENPLLLKAFNDWLARLPASACVLDAGCGHGDPVIAYLLEKGMQFTGSDFSPAMLKRAREQFPQAQFVNAAIPEIAFDGVFDGICSFSSALYLDPIDLFNSIYRLYQALKPGGLLFLYGYDTNPGWRGMPYTIVMGQWMWSWTYSMDEAAQAIEEHGYFELVDFCSVTTQEETEERRTRLLERQAAEEAAAATADGQILPDTQEAEESPMETGDAADEEVQAAPMQEDPDNPPPQLALPEDSAQNFLANLPPPPFYDPLENLPYHYVIVARKKER